MFGFFKKKCNHCGSRNMTKDVSRNKGYSVAVITTTYTCNSCGAKSTKSKVYKKNEKLSNEHKNL
jgi:uncharacterized Zn finger protein